MGFSNPLSPTQLAAALAATTLTVTGQVTTTPTTGTDEDIVRVYSQTQIDALTASDKSTNFVIYNTTTGVQNLCVNGAIIVPPSYNPAFGSFLNRQDSITASWATATFAIGAGFKTVHATLQDTTLATGLRFIAGADGSRWQAEAVYLGSANVPNLMAASSVTAPTQITMRSTASTSVAVQVRNIKYDATAGNLTWEWIATAGAVTTQGYNLNWMGA